MMMPLAPYTPMLMSVSRVQIPLLPKMYTKAIPWTSDGAKMGSMATTRNTPRPGMRGGEGARGHLGQRGEQEEVEDQPKRREEGVAPPRPATQPPADDPVGDRGA